MITKTDEEYQALFDKELVAFQYIDGNNNPTEEYPYNPNGSKLGVAGLVDITGKVLGMMPHPERNVERFHHPNFKDLPEGYVPDGLKIFQNAVDYFN